MDPSQVKALEYLTFSLMMCETLRERDEVSEKEACYIRIMLQ